MFAQTNNLIWIRTIAWYYLLLTSVNNSYAQSPEQCDPRKILTSETCVKCHASEISVWKMTPHFRTFDELHRSAKAKEIAKKMGVTSIKRSQACTQCHYTLQEQEGALKTVAGISCESCHGAAKDWITLHSDYGGPGITKDKESPEHKTLRLRNSISSGMRNPENLYLVARSCLNCHTVPNEKLVNVGGHVAGSLDFNLVAWSQGKLRHNFLSNQGVNKLSPPERLRQMYIIGLVAELEFSTRGTALATEPGIYGNTVAKRAAQTAKELYDIQLQLKHPVLQEILEAFAAVELRTNSAATLEIAADTIANAGQRLADQLKGIPLEFIDPLLPKTTTYK